MEPTKYGAQRNTVQYITRLDGKDEPHRRATVRLEESSIGRAQ